MTIEETRQLGIEFERRVQTMIPEAEIVSKLDTETIYSYLNQYQDKFIHDIYKALDNIPTPSKPSAYVERILQGLLTTTESVDVNKNDNKFSVNLPENFGLYVDSYTTVTDSHRYKGLNGSGEIPNVLISKTKAQEFQIRPQDDMRIMRQPVAYLDSNNSIVVICDRYTEPKTFKMSYYKVPKYMDLFKAVQTSGREGVCELEMDVFDDLVTGAVDLYVQYVAGAEAKKRQTNEQQQKQKNKEDEQ